MKNLLQKSLRQLTLFAFIVFALSIPSYFFLVDWIWLKELDENNQLIAQRIENEFNEQKISPGKLAESIRFWNEIQPVSKMEYTQNPLAKDSVYTLRRQNPYAKKEAIDRFRGLVTNIKINEQHYILVIETNVEETEETVAYIALVTLMFFLILVVGFWLLNRRLSVKLWAPFRDTLKQLKDFKLNDQRPLQLKETNIIEFAELNATLEQLMQHNIAIYKSQKEFIENAAHELQTPLAILKHKIDSLLQSKELTENQYHIAEEMNKALIRSTVINRNLLLLAKIENQQFDNTEKVVLGTLVHSALEDFGPYFIEKALVLGVTIDPGIEVSGNKVLSEILINNLLINAIRYSPQAGLINIYLSAAGFEVSNTGAGTLNPDLLFKRFSKMSLAHAGSGLGLSIVYEICKLHHWQISYRFEAQQHIFLITF